MKITAMTMILMAGAVAQGEALELAAERKVTVCVEGMGLPEVVSVGARARTLTSQMFAGIGVNIEWRQTLRGCPPQGIQISLTGRTPNSMQPGALAYAMPYEGTRIRVFYDRVRQNHGNSSLPTVLAHVLVHEITHILQGITRHSDSGVMKARWDRSDFRNMGLKPLEFEPGDIRLIYNGLTERTGRHAAASSARNTDVAVAGE